MSYLFWISNGYAQIKQFKNEGYALTKEDSIIASKIPALKIPHVYMLKGSKDLPSELNNADLPFFRPTFSQNPYWNCGQSAGIGYAFCYEVNQSRGLHGDVLENQQSVHFSWNFMNTGDGWGVSYLQSFDILKACGNPNLADYGGLFNGGEKRWMSGYELYENAMQNRVREVSYIDVSHSDGLNTLKNWLYDHLNNSPYGGVANIYLSFYITEFLPDESEEAGQPIIIETRAPAGHALTITGYNDSVRFDVNADGRFTNNEDINDDGVVDMKDWEIGALRYKNSSLNNDGYGLIMYRTLALKYGNGGIWNNQAHVIDVKETYAPIATMRLKIKHNSRNKLKLIAGISQDTSMNYPQHTIDFPIFNYQGGENYMQGFNDDDAKVIEVSLDISPLMSFIEPGTDAKYFIQLAEKDQQNSGFGEVIYFSVIDYENSIETISNEFPKTIENNTITRLSLVSDVNYDKVEIFTNELTGIVPGEFSSCQLTASGGKPPYQWEVLQPYIVNQVPLNLSQNNQTQLIFDEDELYGVKVDLNFPFPYYNDSLSTITIFADGFIMFDDRPYPYPYFIGEESMLRNNKLIAPFLTKLVSDEDSGDGVWVNNYNDSTEVIWKASIESYEDDSELNFSLKLFKDGRIETHYEEMNYPERIMWTSGISKGDGVNYTTNSFFYQIGSNSNKAFKYISQQILPASTIIDQNGMLSMLLEDDSSIFDIDVLVKDDNSVIHTKRFQVPSELLYEYEIQAGIDDMINYYDTVSVSFYVKNISADVFQNVKMSFTGESENYLFLKDTASIGTLEPQQSKTIDSALVLVIFPGFSDQEPINISNIITSDQKNWNTDIVLKMEAPLFRYSEISIHDDQNGILDPGEEAELSFSVSNQGHAQIDNFELVLSDTDDVLVIDDPILFIEHLEVGDTINAVFNVKAKRSIPTGTEIEVVSEVYLNNYALSVMKRQLLIGKIPVLILDLEPKHLTGPILMDLFDSLQLKYDYRASYPSDYDDYMSIFICLGSLFYNAEISNVQADILSTYLLNGGSIYMEGRVAWNQEEPTSFHQLFNIEAVNALHYFEFDSIYGVDMQFTDQLIFDYYSDKPYNDYYLKAVGTAFPILNSGKIDSTCAIAYDNGIYKTIGSSIEMNSLIDTDSLSNKINYLLKIIDFFELTDYLYADIFDAQKIYATHEMKVYPNPFNNKLFVEIKGNLKRGQELMIYDLSGRLVKQLILPENNANGIHTFSWDGTDFSGKKLPKGFYILKLGTESATLSKKVFYR